MIKREKISDVADKTLTFLFGAEISLNSPGWEREKGPYPISGLMFGREPKNRLFHLLAFVAEASPYAVPAVAIMSKSPFVEGLLASIAPFALKYVLEEVVYRRRMSEKAEYDLL